PPSVTNPPYISIQWPSDILVLTEKLPYVQYPEIPVRLLDPPVIYYWQECGYTLSYPLPQSLPHPNNNPDSSLSTNQLVNLWQCGTTRKKIFYCCHDS